MSDSDNDTRPEADLPTGNKASKKAAPRKRAPRKRKPQDAAVAVTAQPAAAAAVSEAIAVQPAASEPVALQPPVSQPAASEPAMSEPVASAIVVAKPAAPEASVAPAAQPTPASTAQPAPQPAPAQLVENSAVAHTALIRVPLSVRWRDLDAFNHVNNSKFLSYLEEARLRWMVTLPGHGMDEHVAPVVAAAHLNYRRPIEWPNEIDVELFVERLGNTSLSVGHRIVGANDPSALYCDGSVVLVWIHRETGQPAALPDPVRAACTPR